MTTTHLIKLSQNVLTFSTELTIFKVATIYSELRQMIIHKSSIGFDLTDIEELDGAGAQLIMSYCMYLSEQGIDVEDIRCSDTAFNVLSLFHFPVTLIKQDAI